MTIMETAGANPASHKEYFHVDGVRVAQKCASMRHAVKAQLMDVDAISIAAPSVRAVPGRMTCPVLVASLPRDAGPRSRSSLQETPIHHRVKERIVAASELDADLLLRTLRNTARVASNMVSR